MTAEKNTYNYAGLECYVTEGFVLLVATVKATAYVAVAMLAVCI